MTDKCKRGHLFTEENTYVSSNKRHCRTCRAMHSAKWRKPQKKGQANSRKTHCAKGHPFDEENTLTWRNKRICKTCSRANQFWQRLKRYGLTKLEYDNLIQEQENSCAICGDLFEKTPHIDHDHVTGKVRGLLCYPCNSGLGQFQDNVDFLKKAINYLEK